jgi:ABC-2 type transport system ATP-binding protein
MSLVHDPEILILDEPTVGLDPPGRNQLLELIRDLRDEGRRILVSTHILQDAEMVCDQMLLLEGGSVAFAGPVQELLGEDRGTLVAMGTGINAAFADKLAALGFPVTEKAEGRMVFAAAAGDIMGFWKLAAEEGVEVRYLGRDHPTLEDAVVAVMEGTGAP